MDSNKTNHPISPVVSSNTDQKDREVEIQRDGDGEKQEFQNVVVLMKPSVADIPLKKRRRSADESLENMTTVVNLINFSNDDTYPRGRLSQSPPHQQTHRQPQSPPQQQTQTQLQQRPQPQLQSLPPQQPQTPPQQTTQPQSPPQPQLQLQSLPPQQQQLQSLPPQQPQTPLQLQQQPQQSKSQLPPLPNFPVQTAAELQQQPLQTELKPQSQSQLRILPEPKPENRYKCDFDSCERSFSSYQALGGHKASHSNKEQAASSANAIVIDDQVPSTTAENSCSVQHPREHKCEICFKTFTSGQALGGHKRCHYQGVLNGQKRDNEDSVCGGEGVEGGGIRSNQSVVSELITIGSEKRNPREELCIDLNKSPPAETEKEEGNGSGGGGDGDDSMSATASERKMRFLIECDEDFISKMDDSDSVKIMGKYTSP